MYYDMDFSQINEYKPGKYNWNESIGKVIVAHNDERKYEIVVKQKLSAKKLLVEMDGEEQEIEIKDLRAGFLNKLFEIKLDIIPGKIFELITGPALVLNVRKNDKSEEFVDLKCLICKETIKDVRKTIITNHAYHCPVCSNYKKVVGKNTLDTTHPNIAKLLKKTERASLLVAGSNNKETFVCQYCGFEDEKMISSVTRYGFKCSQCMMCKSKQQWFFLCLLKFCGLEVQQEKEFDWFSDRPYDLYLPEYHAIVEINGAYHKTKLDHYTGKTLDEVQKNDFIKKKQAALNGISLFFELEIEDGDISATKMKNVIESEKNKPFRRFLEKVKIYKGVKDDIGSEQFWEKVYIYYLKEEYEMNYMRKKVMG